jgi:regulatory protein
MFARHKKTYDEAALYECAVGALARKMRTVAELKRLLRQRVGSQDDGEALVEAVIARLKEQKYLNDSQYAALFASYRKENEKFGRRRVITELKTKGVHGDIIEKSVASAYAGSNEEKLARDFLARKRLRKPANVKETARIFRALVRAGFTSKTIFTVLKKWDVEEETLTSLEGEIEQQ